MDTIKKDEKGVFMVTNKALDQKLELLLMRQALIATVVAALIPSDEKRKEFVEIFNKAEDITLGEEYLRIWRNEE